MVRKVDSRSFRSGQESRRQTVGMDLKMGKWSSESVGRGV